MDFAKTCESIASTRSKLEKVRILSQFLSEISSEKDLKISVTFLSGRIFPPGESEREPNVGYSLLWKTISEVTGFSNAELSKLYVSHGDLGDVFHSILSDKKESREQDGTLFQTLLRDGLTLQIVYHSFEELAKTIGQNSIEKKKRILRGLFSSVQNPLEGKYIIKILGGGMRIGLVEGLVEESIAKCFSKSLSEVRMANLLVANAGKVAVLTKQNRLWEAHLEPLHPTNFMLASSAQDAADLCSKFQKMPIFAEFKYDGIRAQLHRHEQKVKIFSRNLSDVTQFFPELEAALRESLDGKGDCILDGEIIAFNEGKPLPFQMLQRRLRKISRSEQDAPIRYFAFDILYLDSSSLIEEKFEARIAKLRSLEFPGAISFSELKSVSSADEVQQMFDESKKLGYEGLVGKNPASPYAPGRRGNSWVKLKKELDTLDVVIVAAEFGNGKRAGVISDYTFAVKEGAELKVVGKAYSGLTDAEIEEMTARLKSITLRDYGYRRVVKPEIVIEVAFDAIQKSERHDSGYALRFPRIKRIRTDKSVHEIDTLEKVSKIYEGQTVRL